MQIREITTLSENFLKRLATDARNNAFKRTTGVDWNTYKLAQNAGQSGEPAATTPAATTPAAPKPAATPLTPVGFDASNVLNQPNMKKYKPAAAPNFTQTNRVQYQPATVNTTPGVNPAAAPVVYTLDGNPLNPSNPIHAKLIAQMQAAGVTRASK